MSDSSTFSQIVVVGSSAGGIEALSTLVHTLSADLPAPLVVAQHLDPTRESHLGQILSRSSTLPVKTLSDYERLEPGVVYVVPANRDVEITDHDIRLVPGTHRSRPSIDFLFASAAEIFGENLIAVVLTGTGSDGAAGALDVQQAGGTVVIQDPVTATFPALPRSLAPSVVDFVVPLPEIGPLLMRLLTGSRDTIDQGDDEVLDQLLRLLRERHGVDFSTYKRATIMRRVQRRMTATNSTSIPDYLRFLRQHPPEQQSLIASFLIKVTRFFRDTDLFSVLGERVLPDVIADAREREHTIRLWSAGCATGEEAYSLAIMLAESLGEELEQFHVRIFATDLDPDAINFARQGIYSPSSLSGVDPQIVDRHFDQVEGGYQISKRIRALMVFGQHDLADRAPFPRVDLILCRNVLIYFTPELQRRILQLFAFSLRDGGYLILGKSETATPLTEAFVPDDSRLKIYRRRGDRKVIPGTPSREMAPLTSSWMTPARPSPHGRPNPLQPSAQQEHPMGPRLDSILFDLPIGVVVVDRHYDIQYINESARLLLGIHASAVGDDLIHQVQTVPPSELRTLIDRAFTSGGPAGGTLRAVDRSSDAVRYLDVVGKVDGEDTASPTVTVCIVNGTEHVEGHLRLEEELQVGREARDRAEQQRERLVETNQELLADNRQLTREMADLRSQNDDFLVGNEELQAATEEVETLNEELQATNEELETLNEELQATVEELNTTNDDLQARNVEIQDLAIRLESSRVGLQAVLNSLGDAIVMIDGRGNTMVTNSRYDEKFSAPLESIDLRTVEGAPLRDREQPRYRAARGEAFQTMVSASAEDGPHTYLVVGTPIFGDSAGGGGVLAIREVEAEASPS